MVKIAIVTRQMITGGVEKALISMLKQFDYKKVKVDLLLLNNGGDLLHDIPEEVTVNVLQSPGAKEVYKYPIASIKKGAALFQLHSKKKSYLEQNKLSSDMLLPLRKEYDIAIAYHAPNTVPVFYVIDKIKAKKKVLWLHGDLETNGGCNPLAHSYYQQYDQIFAVSKKVYQSFIRNCPEQKARTALFYNFVDRPGIQQLAKTGPTYQDEFHGIRILTIGRLNEQKGIDIAIHVCRSIISRGYDIRWYVCGEGEDRQHLEQLIAESGLENRFILLGNQKNPYGYLQHCDLYVQPSRYEGYCTTTNEARMLGKAVITTDVSGAREQFTDQKTGWITEIDENALYDRICWCINHPLEVAQVVENLNASILKDIYGKDHPLDQLLYIED